MPEDEAKRRKDMICTRRGAREVVLADLAVILHPDPPEIKMSAPELDGIPRR